MTFHARMTQDDQLSTEILSTPKQDGSQIEEEHLNRKLNGNNNHTNNKPDSVAVGPHDGNETAQEDNSIPNVSHEMENSLGDTNSQSPSIGVPNEKESNAICDDINTQSFENKNNNYLNEEVSMEDQIADYENSVFDEDAFISSDKPSTPKGNQSDDATDVEEDYDISDDQKRAMLELEMLKRELDYVETEPPEYNVKERLKTLNEELLNEPDVEKRNSTKVMFKENPVDLVVSPCEDVDDKSTIEPSSDPESALDTLPNDDVHSSNTAGQVLSDQHTSKKVLIEKEGKFELVHSDNITAHEVGFASVEDKSAHALVSSSSRLVPQPPVIQRPHTTTGSATRSYSSTTRRVKSASAVSASDSVITYASPYRLSPEQKEKLVKQRQRKLEKQLQDDEAARIQREEKRKLNKEAFMGWLAKKQAELRQNEKNKENMNNSAAIEPKKKDYYGEWLTRKSMQNKQQKLLRKREEIEMTKCVTRHSQEEIDVAFKQWKHQKDLEAKKARLMDLIRSRARLILIRQQKKLTIAHSKQLKKTERKFNIRAY